MIKAWHVTAWYKEYSAIIFAETRAKAHYLATKSDTFEDSEWNEISVRRLPQMDKMYRGNTEMDWDYAEDRIALVKECGWHCSEDYVDYEKDCPSCPAAQFCDIFKEEKYEDG